MSSEHRKDRLLPAELNAYKLLSYSWLRKYPALYKYNLFQYRNIDAADTDTYGMKRSYLSICCLVSYFLNTSNIESALYSRKAAQTSYNCLPHPQAADLSPRVTQLWKNQHLWHSPLSCNIPGDPLQPMGSCCCHPTSHQSDHIPGKSTSLLLSGSLGFY